MDPHTRAFSDLPAFIDQQLSKLANKRVLMYCTGVRLPSPCGKCKHVSHYTGFIICRAGPFQKAFCTCLMSDFCLHEIILKNGFALRSLCGHSTTIKFAVIAMLSHGPACPHCFHNMYPLKLLLSVNNLASNCRPLKLLLFDDYITQAE